MIFIKNLVLQSRYKLPETGGHKEHASSVFHFNAKKVFSDASTHLQCFILMIKRCSQMRSPMHRSRQLTKM
jgi:hypothetical protein